MKLEFANKKSIVIGGTSSLLPVGFPSDGAEVPDITLPELKARLAEKGAQVSVSALWRFCRRHRIPRKKTTAAK